VHYCSRDSFQNFLERKSKGELMQPKTTEGADPSSAAMLRQRLGSAIEQPEVATIGTGKDVLSLPVRGSMTAIVPSVCGVMFFA